MCFEAYVNVLKLMSGLCWYFVVSCVLCGVVEEFGLVPVDARVCLRILGWFQRVLALSVFLHFFMRRQRSVFHVTSRCVIG